MRLIAYYWLSAKQQGDAGSDLDAQRAVVEAFAGLNEGEVVAEYIEVQEGKRPTWPKLAEAIARAQDVQGTLVVAKLDRLVRSTAFTTSLATSGVDFACCDNSHVNPATIGIVAAVADDETQRISARTKAGLIAAKERGVKLGSARDGHWEGREDRRREGARKGLPAAVQAAAKARAAKAQQAYSGLLPGIVKMRDEEHLTLVEIAERLNAEGQQTRAGRPFTSTMILRLLRRATTTKPQPTVPIAGSSADFSDLPLFRLCRDTAGVTET
jgi:DNA invertase Pin-like site-specific DNA recombinase